MGPERPYDREACAWTDADFAWLAAVERGEAGGCYDAAQGAILGWFVCYVAGAIAGFVLAVCII